MVHQNEDFQVDAEVTIICTFRFLERARGNKMALSAALNKMFRHQ